MIAINMEMPSCCGKCTFKEYSYNDNFYHCTRAIGYDIIVDKEKYLDNCPLAEIVTCKDCKYYRVEDDDEYCTNHTIKDNKFWVGEDYFCADAERRE
jgi:hypothetical protein